MAKDYTLKGNKALEKRWELISFGSKVLMFKPSKTRMYEVYHFINNYYLFTEEIVEKEGEVPVSLYEITHLPKEEYNSMVGSLLKKDPDIKFGGF